MYNYSPRIIPPAPFLFAGFSATNTSGAMSIHALLDTGADSSALPIEVIEQLGLQQVDAGFVGGINEPRALSPIFAAFVSLAGSAPSEIDVYGLALPFAILGRDVLNHYHITLDGPNLTLTIAR